MDEGSKVYASFCRWKGWVHAEMEVRQAIDDLKFSVEHVTAEDELLGAITARVIDLRLAFRSHRSDFTSGDIEFLKRLNGISDHLLAFVELKEKLTRIESLK